MSCLEQPPSEPVLGEGIGWLVILGFGGIFTIITAVVSKFEMSSTNTKITSEHFNTAGRNVGSGLTAAVIVSQWTWAATLLQSSNMGWKVGVSGPFWYASGATIQILLFAILAIQVKIRTPTMHTYLETIYIRWGKTPHCIFIVFALLCNVIVTAMLLLGGAATIEALTGLDKIWSSFLIPLGVLVYTFFGGLRATFFASYLHTAIIFSVLVIFGFSVYASSTDGVGSAPDVYNSLWESSKELVENNNKAAMALWDTPKHCYDRPVGLMENQGLCFKYDAAAPEASGPLNGAEGGHCSYDKCDGDCEGEPLQIIIDGKDQWKSSDCGEGELCYPSYTTMQSGGGLLFGVVNIVGNFGTVFVDQAYWQSAIAAEPKATVTGFLIGGMVWFSVPMFMATTFGLAGRALAMAPGAYNSFWISAGQAGDGLVPAIVIAETLGSGGAFALLMQLFMAITSTGSAEVIAVSSILTYDVFWTYLNPELKEKVKKAASIFTATCKDATPPVAGIPDEVVSKAQGEYLFDALSKSEWVSPTAVKEDFLGKFDEDGLKYYEVKAALVELSDGANYEGKILVRMSRFFTCIFAVFMAFLSILLNEIGRLSGGCFGLGFVYMAMGVVIGSAVCPVAMSILWDKANGTVCTLSAVLGLIFAFTTWFIHAAADDIDGSVSVCSLGRDYPLLSSNLVDILSSCVMAFVGSLVMGPRCAEGHTMAESEGEAYDPQSPFNWGVLTAPDTGIACVDDVVPERDETETDLFLQAQSKRANIQAIALTFVLVILWPLPMHFIGGVFTEGGFTVWIVCAFVWAMIAAVVIIVLPPIQMVAGMKAANVKTEKLGN